MISLKLANREIKNNFKYWMFFTLNLSIGLIGFTFIFLFKENVGQALELRSKTLLSSDIAITGRRALADDEKSGVDNFLSGKFEKKTRLIELYSMGASDLGEKSKTRLVHVKAIAGIYPLIGKIELEDKSILDIEYIKKLQMNPLVVISSAVAHQFKLKISDEIKFGLTNFKVSGIIKSDSTTSMRGVSLAPKVYIGQAFLKATGLTSFGTIAWYTDFYNLNKTMSIEETQKKIFSMIKDPAIKVRTPKNSSEQLSRVINYLTDYLGLIGVVALLLSTVGASYLFQSYLFDRLKQIGILKTLGLKKHKIFLSFIYIIIFLGLLSTMIASLVSKLLLPFAITYLQKWMVGEFNSDINLEVFTVILCIAIFINILICIPVLIKVFKNKTSNLLMGELQEEKGKREYFYYIPALLFLWGLSVWQAHSFIIGSIFTLVLIIIFCVVLFILPIILNKLSSYLVGKKISSPLSLEVGFALRLISRNKISTILTILCMAIGITLLSVIGHIDSSLKSELTATNTPRPSLFLFDIQDEQYEDLKKFSKQNEIPLIDPTPMIRARLIKKNGVKIKRENAKDGFSTREEEKDRRFNNRGVNLSYSDKLNPSESIIEGNPFSGKYSGEGLVEISLETRYADRINVKIGDTITYDVLDVEIQGKVINLRKVKWTNFLPNFFIIIQPGVLEDAPKTYLSAVESVDFKSQLEIQDKIVDKFKNISILNVTEIITKILSMFTAMAWAISIMSFCCISVGLFVLYSILQNQLHKKKKDLALQKLMGMSESLVFKTLFIEYMFLACSAVIIGNSIGAIMAFIVSKVLLDGVFVFNWMFFFGFNTLLLLVTSIIIFISYKNNYDSKISKLLLD